MKDIYISSCIYDGGILHYELYEDGKLNYRDKVSAKFPMYTKNVNGNLYACYDKIFWGIGGIGSYKINEDKSLELQGNIIPSCGECPCHIEAVDNKIYVVNYQSGNVVCSNGFSHTNKGWGPNKERQERAHTHFVSLSPDEKYLLVTDLGLDKIYTYDMDLKKLGEVDLTPGAGPRHLAYSDDGKYIYCANELASSISTFTYDDGKLQLVNNYKIEVEKENYPSAIRYYKDQVFIANRGDNSIYCYDANGCSLSYKYSFSTEGDWPRDFIILGDYILVANERSDNVVVFKAEGNTVTKTWDEEIKTPLCISE